MRTFLMIGLIAASLVGPPARSQSLFDTQSFRNNSVGGIHLYNVAVYSGYTTSAYPGGSGQLPSIGSGQLLGADVNYGASASLGWQYHRQRTDFSALYFANYGGLVRYSEGNGFGQSLSLSLSQKLSPKWTLSLSASGSELTAAQFLFQPSSLALTAATPATFDDLAATLSVGQFSNSQVASLLTGAPTLESPARSLLLGDRVLSYSGQASLSYAYSSRLNFHLSSFTAAGANRTGGTSTTPAQNYVLPHSMGANAGMGFSYLLTPRTNMGLDVEEIRIDNRYQAAYTTTASASIGRKMSEHWFVNLHGGGSMSQVIMQANGTPKTKQFIGGGSIGFQKYRHTLIGSYDRSSSDLYGLALGTSTTISTAWNFHQPGSRLSIFASFGQQRIRNTGYESLSGWEASGGAAERLSDHLNFTAQYVYMDSAGTYLGNLTDFTVQGVRVALNWTPLTAAR